MMEDEKHYICKYCFEIYIPKRTRVQKYCSNTCRSKAHHTKKSKIKFSLPATDSQPNKQLSLPQITAKENTLGAAGIGNAAIGNLAASSLKALITSEDNIPATKGDLKLILEKLDWRYYSVSNLAKRFDGSFPYHDLETGIIVYMFH